MGVILSFDKVGQTKLQTNLITLFFLSWRFFFHQNTEVIRKFEMRNKFYIANKKDFMRFVTLSSATVATNTSFIVIKVLLYDLCPCSPSINIIRAEVCVINQLLPIPTKIQVIRTFLQNINSIFYANMHNHRHHEHKRAQSWTFLSEMKKRD